MDRAEVNRTGELGGYALLPASVEPSVENLTAQGSLRECEGYLFVCSARVVCGVMRSSRSTTSSRCHAEMPNR